MTLTTQAYMSGSSLSETPRRYRRCFPGSLGRWGGSAVAGVAVDAVTPDELRALADDLEALLELSCEQIGWRLRDLGFDIEERQLLMGHENPETTIRYYGHLTIEDVARKVAAL